MYKILEVEWFAGSQPCIGVVAISTHNGWKAYIGIGAGVSEDEDINRIAGLGTRIHKRIAVAVFPNMDPEKYDES